MPGQCIRVPRSSKPKVLRDFLRRAFVHVVGCAIQRPEKDDGLSLDDLSRGWPCRTCFFSTFRSLELSDEEIHALWLIQLRLRNNGDNVSTYNVRTVPTIKGRMHNARCYFEQRYPKLAIPFYRWLDSRKKEIA